MDTSKLSFFARIIKILKTLILVLGAGTLILWIVLWTNPSIFQAFFLDPDASFSLSLDGLTLYFSNPPASFQIHPFLEILGLEIAISLAISWYALDLIYRIIEPIARKEPFLPAACKALNQLAWLSLVMILISPALSALAQYMLLNQFDFSHLLAETVGYSVTYEYTLEISQLVIPAFLFALCAAFKQGQQLQEFSDGVI